MSTWSVSDWHIRFRLQAAWTAELRRYLLGRVGLPAQPAILEVGCGTGAVLSDLPRLVPGCRLHGLDLAPAYLAQARQDVPSARLVQGDAHALPYPTGVFDLVCCHFLLLWLSDPLQSLVEMRRITRSGGWVMALAEPDYGGRIDFPPSLEHLGQAQTRALQQQGADPLAGRQLAAWFTAAGLQDIEVGLLAGQWRLPLDLQTWQAEWAMLRADLGDQFPPAELDRLQAVDRSAYTTGSRLLFVPTFYALGQA
jgi:ubiquinone/menaquinone biosynthesis C-methylase UbiE